MPRTMTDPRGVSVGVSADADADVRAAIASPCALTLTITLPGLGLSLHASYVGHDGEQVVSTIVLLARDDRPRLLPIASFDADAITTTGGRRACLLHFLGVVADELRDRGRDPAIEVGEVGLRELDALER